MVAQFGLAVFLCGLRTVVAQTHPVENTISLLEDLVATANTQGKQEEVTYGKFQYWCTNSVKSLLAAIGGEKTKIAALKSEVKALKEQEDLLQEQIDALNDEISKLQAADRAATLSRTSTAALFATAEADYTATIKAIALAIQALETAQTNTDSLLLTQRKVQRVLALVETKATEQQREELAAFAQDNPARPVLKAKDDYDAHVKKYAFKSSSVIELLKQLQLKFEDEKLAATKAETNSVNTYRLAQAARQDLTAAAGNSKTAKADQLSDTQGKRTQAEADLSTQEQLLQEDEGTLKQTQNTCAVKTSEWAERSATRSAEIEAMQAAIEILSKVTGVRTEAPQNPVPPQSPVMLLQFTAVDPKMRAVQLLRASARATHSRALERLAQEISAHLQGPFDAINNMIQKLIFHLMDEQKDEDNHKNWCDLELSKTETSEADKQDQKNELSTKIEAAKAKETELTNDIVAADRMVATITEHMAEATEIREAGKEENKRALKDAYDAQEALSRAIAVLEAFYKDSGMVEKKAWELLQRGVTLPAKPATWASSYVGVADPMEQPTGIITTLKEVIAKFAEMEAQTKAQEEEDTRLYKEDMKQCAIEKARKLKLSDEYGLEKKRVTDKIGSMTATKGHVSDEHEAVTQYLKDLQHACVVGNSTYVDRKAARDKEIAALQDAQKILASAFEESNATTPGGVTFLQRRPSVRAHH